MRVIGLDVHRSMAVVAVLEKGRLTSGGRIDLTRDAVIAFRRKLRPDDEVVIEATVNTAAIVHAKIKTDKIDAAVLAKLHASGFLPEGRCHAGTRDDEQKAAVVPQGPDNLCGPRASRQAP
jgi:transposase